MEFHKESIPVHATRQAFVIAVYQDAIDTAKDERVTDRLK